MGCGVNVDAYKSACMTCDVVAFVSHRKMRIFIPPVPRCLIRKPGLSSSRSFLSANKIINFQVGYFILATKGSWYNSAEIPKN